MTLLQVVKYLRDHTTYPNPHDEIMDLSTFKHWEATNLLPPGALCDVIKATESLTDGDRFAIPDKGYYIRRDWGDKKIYILGDFHGSLHSMLDILLDMEKLGAFEERGTGRLKDDVAIVCLGDLLDRSPYTLECFYLMLRLCLENPQNCVLTAGNHETDQYLWDDQSGSFHEMQGEYENKCPDGTTLRQRIVNITEKLPSSLIAKTALGTVQFNHGSYESYTLGSKDFGRFVKFVAFEGERDKLPTRGDREGNALQWGDVETDALGTNEAIYGRPVSSSDDVERYLKDSGLRMLVRGHSDFANLSLLYKKDTEPSNALQMEGQIHIPMDPNRTYPYFGQKLKDPRPAERQTDKGGVFVRNGFDFTNEPQYDLFTLHQSLNMESFDKHLVAGKDDNTELLSVTVASSPFSKPMPPTNMMSCYLLLEN